MLLALSLLVTPHLAHAITFSEPQILSTGAATYACKLANAGDTNADGYDDLLVSDCTNATVYLYLGGSTGLGSSPSATWTGPAGSDFGRSLSGDGDLNGDGYDDVLIGAPDAQGGRGCAVVYYGGATAPRAPGWHACGASSTGHVGGNVTIAGDIDADGLDDAVVSPTSDGSGRLLVFQGRRIGLSTVPSAGYSLSGYAGDGESLRPAGDVNGDGYADVIVGAPHYDTDGGSFRVYYGGSGPTLASSTQFDASTLAAGWNFGVGRSVSTLGDIDHDGYDDVIVGAPEDGQPGYTYGYMFVFRGSATGLDLGTLQWYSGDYGYDPIGTLMGWSVSGGGDLDGDGNPDFGFGSPGVWWGGSNHGAFEVALTTGSGLPTGESGGIAAAWTSSGAFMGTSVDVTGDYNGDGCDDAVTTTGEWPLEAGHATSWDARIFTPGC
jgi:hypothetical protein